MSKLVKVLIGVDLILVNAGVGYGLYRLQRQTVKEVAAPVVVMPTPAVVGESEDKCGTACQKLIADKLAQTKEEIIASLPTPVPTQRLSTTLGTVKKTRKEEILTIPGSGASGANEWTTLAGTSFYFDTRDYPGLVEVYFEANIKLVNGNGTAYVRLYDQTNQIGVNGSENNTVNQTDTWTKSQKVYFWAGRNLIQVQAKSLTADTVEYTQGRLRIVVEN